jgi:hypothetical protein
MLGGCLLIDGDYDLGTYTITIQDENDFNKIDIDSLLRDNDYDNEEEEMEDE